MRDSIILCLIGVFLTGCERSQATIPEGCYRFKDGAPFLSVARDEARFVPPASLKSFHIGRWGDTSNELASVSPAFVVHDGTVGPPRGPSRMAEIVPGLAIGTIRYRRQAGRDFLIVPMEAYGEVELVRSGRC